MEILDDPDYPPVDLEEVGITVQALRRTGSRGGEGATLLPVPGMVG